MSKADNQSTRVGRVLTVFEKRGGAGEYTDAFDKLSADAQHYLRNSSHLRDEETPILASYFSEESWVLLTSERLIWLEGQVHNSLAWEDLRDATIPASAIAALKSKVKRENARLEVVTSSGKKEINIEPGKPFSGFWNVLKMIPKLS